MERALAVSRRLPRRDWLRVLDRHFLHVAIALRGRMDDIDVDAELARGATALAGVPAFVARFPRLNCFHTAVVAEAEPRDAFVELGRRLDPGVDETTELPHLTLAVFTRATAAAELRGALVATRETSLGELLVDEVQLVSVPASRRTILSPWRPLGRVRLAER